ncbi:MAG: lysophospholipid acyltransferase family protein [Nitriliruptorales bacterium]
MSDSGSESRIPAPPTAPSWIRALARPLVGTWLGLEIEGAGNVPTDGPVILAPHHRSHADVLAVGAATKRPLTYLGSAHLVEIPVAKWVLPRLGMIVVRRGEGDLDALRLCNELLAKGAALVVFPEGGRTRDGKVYRPRSGVARLASTAGCPVVPAGIVGTDRIWAVGSRPRVGPGHVRVSFGAPIAPPTADAGSRRRFADELHDALVGLSGAPRGQGFLVKDVG